MELDTINAFFNDHLLKVEYFNFESSARAAAVRMAERDVEAELGRTPDSEEYLEVAAVGEQTIYLLQHPVQDDGRRIVSERVEGVGSRTYAQNSELPGIAPRARRYLRALKGSTLTLARG